MFEGYVGRDRHGGRTAIGVDFGGTNIEVALASARGLLERVRLDTRAQQGPDQALQRTAAAVRHLEHRAVDAYAAPVRAYAAVAPGVIQPDRILLTPNLPGWENIALARRLQQALEIDQVPAVCNDVRAGALAEVRFGALRGVDPGVYASLGTGIAAALTVGGEVVGGAHQAAGEIAYVDPGGASAVGVADGRAPLEEIVGGKALGDRAGELLGVELTAAALFERTDSAAREIVDEMLDTLGRAIANIAVFVDPERVVVGGGMMASADAILPALSACLDRRVPFPPQVVAAHFMEDASLYGAVALALDQLGSDQPGSAQWPLENPLPSHRPPSSRQTMAQGARPAGSASSQASPADPHVDSRFACKDSRR
ncbi:ROK family protein [Streptomyces sp. NA02950]|uniref:ROK family protein n=1 Tax=Streptomyces sp. NA02950 TaxID=2742137 RepID=UPI0015927058|nr:ROK family protein [Streptomyces sp. NA02950]QKV90573.1 ROK family protein [Streptomyces sp. NA02950]